MLQRQLKGEFALFGFLTTEKEEEREGGREEQILFVEFQQCTKQSEFCPYCKKVVFVSRPSRRTQLRRATNLQSVRYVNHVMFFCIFVS